MFTNLDDAIPREPSHLQQLTAVYTHTTYLSAS